MERRVAMVLVTAIVGFASQGCGEVDDGQPEGDQAETIQSALGNFGAWDFASGPGLRTPSAPALARGTGTTSLVAFMRDAGPPAGGIFSTTKSNATGFWSFFFANVDSGSQFVTGFTAGPSAVLLDVPSGPLVDNYAIVAKRADNQFYFSIRKKSTEGGRGAIAQDWAPLPGGIFSQSFSAPAITFIPQSSSVGPQRLLVVTGVGDDGVVYWATNQLSSLFTYNHHAWTLFHKLPGGNPANQTFIGPPAITFACQFSGIFGPKSSMALAVMAADPNGTRTFFSRKFDGASWSGWSQVVNGTFHDGPALAGRPGCSSNPEISLFGRGEDDQIWVTTQLSGGAAGFTQLPLAPPGSVFQGLPSAVGTTAVANVDALTSSGAMVSNAATSIF